MKKRMMALLLSGVLVVSALAGCGTQMDKSAVVATDGETQIPLGVANFAVRLTQAQYDDFYTAYFGQDVWRSDIYGTGVTTGEDLKESILQELYAMYALKNHADEYGVSVSTEDAAAISAAAESFISANSAEALKALGAEKGIVETYLELVTIQDRMYKEIIKGADTNVSDAEAKTSAYSQVYVSKTSYTAEDGTTMTYTEEEKEALAQNVKAFTQAAKEKGIKDAAEAYGYSVTEGTYNEDSSVLEVVKTALTALTEDGAVSDLLETDNGYYVVQMDAVMDAEATGPTVRILSLRDRIPFIQKW